LEDGEEDYASAVDDKGGRVVQTVPGYGIEAIVLGLLA
jgi:hypothetical protein